MGLARTLALPLERNPCLIRVSSVAQFQTSLVSTVRPNPIKGPIGPRAFPKSDRSRMHGRACGFRRREQIKARPALAGRERQPQSSGRSLATEMMRPKAVSKTKANPHERSAEIEAGSVTGRVIGRVVNRRRINHDGRWLRIIINRRWPRHGGGVNRRRTINRWPVRHGRPASR